MVIPRIDSKAPTAEKNGRGEESGFDVLGCQGGVGRGRQVSAWGPYFCFIDLAINVLSLDIGEAANQVVSIERYVWGGVGWCRCASPSGCRLEPT